MNLKDEIINNKNLIYSIASRYSNYHSIEDLFQAGCLGMIEAYEKYDKTKNIKFTTYAYPYILGAVTTYVRENSPIKINKDIQSLINKIDKAKNILIQNYMRLPSNKEISDFLELPLELIDKIDSYKKTYFSLDDEAFDDFSNHELIGNYQDNDMYIALKDEIESLNEPEKTIIKQRYFNDKTQTEIAKSLNLSQVDVSRKEHKVLKKLKQKLSWQKYHHNL